MALEPTERLELYSDIIISKILNSSEDRAVVTMQLQPEVFTNENFLIYKTIYNFRERNIVPDKEFLTMYLTRNPKLILSNRDNVEPTLFSDTGEDMVTAFITATVNKLVRLKNEDHSNEDIQLILEKFRIDFKTIYMQRVLDISKLILNDKYEVGRRVLSGVEDSRTYYEEEVVKLETLISNESGGGYKDAEEEGMADNSNDDPIKVADFHRLEFLNELYGGIKAPYFYNIMAPPKGGKTKFCCRVAHTAKVQYGTDVAFWPIEGGKRKILAELRAIHFDYFYNELQGNNYTGLSGQDILDNNFPSEEYRQLEAVSRADLFTNPNYGRLKIIDEPLEFNTYINHLKAVVNRYGVRLIIVDYLQLITDKTSRKSKSEIIGQAYQETLKFCNKYHVSFISPSQFKQEFIKDLNSGKDVDTRVGGGESSEIIRTPDVNIAFYGTPMDIENNRLTLLSVPSRVAKPFEPRQVFIDLGFSFFADGVWDQEG